jgi:type IV pilus assembly protein PilC
VERVEGYYEREIDAAADILSSVIQPAIIRFLGFVVAGILVARYLPMFDRAIWS